MNEAIAQDPWAQRVYLAWLARDVRYALDALEKLVEHARLEPVPPAAWIYLEDVLVFTGKVSRMLWPVTEKKKDQTDEGVQWRRERGPYLRKVLEVNSGSPLKDRKVRNGSEHFDEHLDEWVVHHPRPTLEELEAGTLEELPAPPMRMINAQSQTVEVVGVQFELGPVDLELRRILARIEELQPLAKLPNPEAAALLGSLPPIPVIPLDAPTERPDEDVTMGADV